MKYSDLAVIFGLTYFVVTLSSCSAKKPFMCCASKTTFSCTQEIPDGEVVGKPGEFCAVSTDIFKAQAAAQAGGCDNGSCSTVDSGKL